mmetsp:Transcript_7195/g.10685  ORF Transcript_7195/g.10685 Transcript_7195/m.10685 type:complete len:767 (+) Transcript_7195:39-2339(+)
MSSTILYKFRSGTNFEPLPLPGTSARLIDIKRAIVKAKKLDRNTTTGSLDFDFAIQNANTNEEYGDDTMILPRGTRIIVRRVATERNMGLLHRMAMGNGGNANNAPSSAVRSDFYTIRSHDRVEEDEFVDQDAPQAASAVVDESAELEALKAVTDQAASVYGSSSGASSGGPGGPNKSNYVAGGGGPNGGGRGGGGPPQFGKPPPHNMQQQQQQSRPPRPNADPELRQQELPKKKTTTGIPRTFLSLSAPAPTPAEGDNTEEEDAEGAGGGGLASQLNPNQHVFQALINRAGGQSIGGEAGKRRDLDYALKLTATSIPEHLQCGICKSVVKNAMLVPWDPVGRPTCESCIRDALAQNGFKCPLTGTEGVSPDDLFPNVGLRKAAELFVEDIMQQMDQIEKQLEAEEAEEEKRNALAKEKEDSNVFEGDAGEGGTLLTRKAAKAGSGKKGYEDDLFGGGDDFGGDVFDVAEDDVEEEDDNMTDEPVTNESDAPKSSGDKVDDNNNTKTETTDATVSSATDPIEPSSNEKKSEEDVGATKKEGGPGTATNEGSEHNSEPADSSREQHEKNDSSHNLSNNTASTSNRRRNEAPKRRGPPAGYMLGPAGVSGPSPNKFPPPNNNVPPPPPPRGHPMMGRGSGMNDRGPPGGNYPDNHYGGGRGGRGHQNFGRGNNDWNRKRDFNQMDGGGMHQEMNQGGWGGAQRDNYGGRGNPHYQGGGRGNPHYQGGGRGRFDYDGGRGDGYRGGRGGGRGRGNFRGGRGNYRGRGRW